jgi:hypothetical protein
VHPEKSGQDLQRSGELGFCRSSETTTKQVFRNPKANKLNLFFFFLKNLTYFSTLILEQ